MNAEHEKEVIVALAKLAEDAEEKGQKQTAGILYGAIADISYGKETSHDRFAFGYSIAARHLSVVQPTNMTRTEATGEKKEPVLPEWMHFDDAAGRVELKFDPKTDVYNQVKP